MKMLIIHILPLVFIPVVQAFGCGELDVCNCDGIQLSCICSNRQNITLNMIMNFEIREVLVKSCGSVYIPMGALSHLQLEKVDLVDIDHLNVRPFALAGVQTISYLRIANISNFNVLQYGFSDLCNVTTILISNVTSTKLSKGSFFGIADVENFVISDSTFDLVEPLAMILTNITSLKVINTKFNTLENMSIRVHYAKEVNFIHTSFHVISNTSFLLSFVDHLVFDQCTFGTMNSTAILTRDLRIFKFHNCSVEELETDALINVDVSEQVTFANNSIILANENSLIPNMVPYWVFNRSQSVIINDGGNRFTCDCRLSWLWTNNKEGIYNSLLSGSHCIGFPNITLSSLEPIWNSAKQCIKLDTKPTEKKIIKAGVKSLDAEKHVLYVDSQSQVSKIETKLFVVLLFGYFTKIFFTRL